MRKKILLALLYLPVLFAVWYYCSPLIALISSILIAPVASWLSSGLISSVDYLGVVVNATLCVPPGNYGELIVPVGQTAELSISARPMVYGYSVPLFYTLLLAFSSRPIASYLKWLSLGALLLGIGFGTLMEILKTLYFNLDPALLPKGPLGSFGSNLLAICYQLSTLILPSVLPVVLWFSLSGKELFSHYFEKKEQ